MGQLIFLIICISAWLTHVVSTLIDNNWGLLLVGGLIPPIGVIHGVLIWIGVV